MKINTVALRRVIVRALKRVEALQGRVYYAIAPADRVYPYCVFRLKYDDSARPAENWTLHVEVFDSADTADIIDHISDQIMKYLDAQNLPNEEILPTFYLIDRDENKDTEKRIEIRDLRFIINNYTLEA